MDIVNTKIAALFQDLDRSVEFANRIAAAYARSQGQDHAPFGADKQMDVAMNLAALYAADVAAQLIVVQRFGVDGLREDRYMDTIKLLAKNELGETSGFIADIAANLAWRSGQPFRGLERLSRPINMAFTSLSVEERAKDRQQIMIGAAFIAEHLSMEAAQAA